VIPDSAYRQHFEQTDHQNSRYLPIPATKSANSFHGSERLIKSRCAARGACKPPGTARSWPRQLSFNTNPSILRQVPQVNASRQPSVTLSDQKIHEHQDHLPFLHQPTKAHLFLPYFMRKARSASLKCAEGKHREQTSLNFDPHSREVLSQMPVAPTLRISQVSQALAVSEIGW
jgi:hypothetical protein